MTKPSLGQILLQGLQQSFRLKPILAFYLSNLLLSLIPTLAIVANLTNSGRNPYLLQLLSQDPLNSLVDLGMGGFSNNNPGALVLLFIFAFLLQRLCYDFLVGGAIASWDTRYSFWQACTRWFATNIGISLLVIISSIVIIIFASILSAAVHPLLGFGIGLLLIIALNNVGEFARARAVVNNRRNPFSLFFSALWFCISHPITWITCALGLLIILLTQFPQNIAFSANTALVLGIALQQVILLIASWSKALRLSWAYHYQQQRINPNATPTSNTSAIPQVTQY